MDYDFNNFQKLVYENSILKKQIEQLEEFVLDTRHKNIELVNENSRLQKIKKVKFILFSIRLLKTAYKKSKDELYK
jgi:hypothetical protein